MNSRPLEAMTIASAFIVGSTVVACPPVMSDTLLPSAIDRSLEECSSNRKEDATGWQRLQLLLASRDDWIEMCAEQIQSDLKAVADRDYESGIVTDQSFRHQIDEIDKFILNQKAANSAINEYNDSSIEQFVVIDGNEKVQRIGKVAGERTVETIPGYMTISK